MSSDDAEAGRPIAFEQALARQSLIGEQRRATFIAALAALFIVYFVARMTFPDPEGDMISPAFWSLSPRFFTLVGAVGAYELAVRWLVGRSMAEDRPLPRWIPYFSATIEASSPTIAMMILSTQIEPLKVLQVSIPFIYFISIIGTILGLNYRVCLFTGLLSGAGYLGLCLYWLETADPTGALRSQFPPNILKAFLLVVAGVCASFIAAQLKRQFVAAVLAGEEARVALESESRAREATRAKSVFLANMSHELRTPLNAVIGFAQLMDRDDSLSPAQRTNLAIIGRSGEHLLGLINDVLSLAKIEAGRLTLAEQTFDLVALLQGVEAMIRVRAEAKGIKLVVELDDGLPRRVRGDDGKLRQVLINLLGNAVKFTNCGGVTLRARWASGRAQFEVEDTGYGIAEEEIGKLFEGFGQTESGRSSQEGTGLGLAISRQIVRLMGGDIRVASELGKGSRFSIEVDLPLDEEGEPHVEHGRVTALAPGTPRPRLLVVDDVEENRLLLVQLLSAVGFEVREAANGAEALEQWRTWQPALIWMDVRMPVMDGREATRRIREVEAEARPKEPMKIVALTASAFEHERDALLAQGFDGVVTKPFREATIFETLVEQLGVEFLYEEQGVAAAAGGESVALTSERLADLPAEQISRLYDALGGGDLGAAMLVVDEIRPANGEIADEIMKALKGFQIDELLTLVERIERTA